MTGERVAWDMGCLKAPAVGLRADNLFLHVMPNDGPFAAVDHF